MSRDDAPAPVEYTISRTGLPPLRFQGLKVPEALTSMAIYRTMGGQHVLAIEYMTEPGLSDYTVAAVCPDEDALRDAVMSHVPEPLRGEVFDQLDVVDDVDARRAL